MTNDKAIEAIIEAIKMTADHHEGLCDLSNYEEVAQSIYEAVTPHILAGQWRDIDSAPKDGTYIWMMWVDGIIPDIVQWNKRFQMWLPCDCEVDDITEDELQEEVGNLIDRYVFMQNRGVAWMPLPNPPQTPSEE